MDALTVRVEARPDTTPERRGPASADEPEPPDISLNSAVPNRITSPSCACAVVMRLALT